MVSPFARLDPEPQSVTRHSLCDLPTSAQWADMGSSDIIYYLIWNEIKAIFLSSFLLLNKEIVLKLDIERDYDLLVVHCGL